MGAIKYLQSSSANAGSAGTVTSYTLSWSNTATLNSSMAAFVFVSLTTASDQSGATASATYGGQTMTSMGTRVQSGGTAGLRFILAGFYLLDPPTGAQTVAATISNQDTNFQNKQYVGAALTYSNVKSLTGYTSSTSGANTASTSSLSLTGTAATDLCIFAHCREDATAFSSYNQTQRITDTNGNYNTLLVGDAAGNGSTVTSTATPDVADIVMAVGARIQRTPETGFFATF